MKKTSDEILSIDINRCKNINKMMHIQNIVLETLSCKICKKIPFKPYKLQHETNTYYCLECLEKDPEFELKIKENIVPPSFLEEKLLEKLEIQCKNYKFGCSEVYNYKDIKELQHHEKECEKLYIKCPWKNCSAKVLKSSLDSHLMNCDFVMIKCSRCKQKYGQNSAKFHDCIPSLFNLIKKIKISVENLGKSFAAKIEILENRLFEKNDKEVKIETVKEVFHSDFFHERLANSETLINLKQEFEEKLNKQIFNIEEKFEENINEKIVIFKKENLEMSTKFSEETDKRINNLFERISSEDDELLQVIENKLNKIITELAESNKKHEEHYEKNAKFEQIIKDLVHEKEKTKHSIDKLKNESVDEAIKKIKELDQMTTAINNELLISTKSAHYLSLNSKKEIFVEAIKAHPMFKEILTNNKLQLIFKASDHGFSAKLFHDICDGVKPTITVIKSENGNIFGAYTPLTFKQNMKGYVRDPGKKSFIFSLTYSTKHPHYLNENKALYNDSDFGPTFGGGHDLHLSNECNKNYASYARLGHTYKLKDATKLDSEEAKVYLAGSFNFKVIEYEVYKLVA